MRLALSEMPQYTVPAHLAARLRVAASHAREDRMNSTWAARLVSFRFRCRLFFDNLMRPFAVPVAGGVLSAFFSFALLVPSLGFPHDFSKDVPLGLYTEASLEETSELDYIDQNVDAVVQLEINERGQVTAYSLQHGDMTPQLEKTVGSVVLFSTFAPATWFGQPTSGKLSLSFRKSQILVRG